MRLFVALKISNLSADIIEKWQISQAKIYPEFRWTEQSQLHLTLRFLGDREPCEVISAMKTLKLTELLPVEYTLFRSGSFRNLSSLFWLSGSFSPELFSIVRRLNSVPDGHSKTGKEGDFSPHITIARSPRGISCSAPLFNERINEFSNSIHLINSRLTQEGPVYSTLYSMSG